MNKTAVSRQMVMILAGLSASWQAFPLDPASEVSAEGSVRYNPNTASVMDDDAIAFTSNDSGTLTVGQGSVLGCTLPKFNFIYGFISTRTTGNFGTYSPTSLTGGKTVAQVDDVQSGTCIGSSSNVSIGGFSSNPGSSWLSSVTCNGVQNLASAATFFYSGGFATWTWSQLFGLSGKKGANVTCTIVHD